MKSSMTKNVTQGNDYLPCEIPCLTPGVHLTFEKEKINR